MAQSGLPPGFLNDQLAAAGFAAAHSRKRKLQMRHLQDQLMSAANFGLVEHVDEEDEMDDDDEDDDEPDDDEDDVSGGSSMARNSPKRGRLIADLLFPSSQHINENKPDEQLTRFEVTAQDLSMGSKVTRYSAEDEAEDIVNEDEGETTAQEDNEDEDTNNKGHQIDSQATEEEEEDDDDEDDDQKSAQHHLKAASPLDSDETKENMPAEPTADFRASPAKTSE